MSKPYTCGENCLYIIIFIYYGMCIHSALFKAIFHMYTTYTLEKSSNLDSSVETKVIEIIVLLKELDNGRHS